MSRYLMFLSYIGTSFRGAQRTLTAKNGRPDDLLSVQGQVEIALKGLNPLNEPIVVLSSRTDSGVHALCSSMHVDLQTKSGHKYPPSRITVFLNRYFEKQEIPIRILKTYLVPSTFHCRYNAISRTYLYRLAITNQNSSNSYILDYLPVEDYQRCYFLCQKEFDIAKVQEAANLFLGTHDFRSFMHKSTMYPSKITRRNIKRFDVVERRPQFYSSYSVPKCIQQDQNYFKYYDILIESNGFLHNQVRRTVGCLIAVGKGIVSTGDIKFMLEIPSRHSWNPRIKTAPPFGLYLCEVAYLQSDWDSFEDKCIDY